MTDQSALVAAGVRVLAREGDTQRLSLRAVATEAGVTPPAVYRHFPDRRALIAEVVRACFARFATDLAAAGKDATDPFDALRHRCRAYVAFGVAEPRLYRVLFGAWSAGPKAVGTYGRQPHPGADSFGVLSGSIQQCLTAGARAHGTSASLAFLLWSALHGMTDLRTGKPELPWPAPDLMIDQFLAGLGLTKPR